MITQLLKLPATQYHADEIGSDRPALSSSIANVLLSQSPYHAWLAHPKLGNLKREATPAMARGSLIHAIVFDESLADFVVIEADNYRSKIIQGYRDEAVANGLTPILVREFDAAKEVAFAITTKLHAEGFDLAGQSEMTAIWEEESDRVPVLCRGMMDHVWLDRACILDLKTTSNAHPKAIQRSVIDHGYAVQWAAYTSAVRKLNPDMAGRERMTWVFVEEMAKGSPERVMVTFAEPDGSMKEYGRVMWDRAVNQWAGCLASGVWPGYGTVRIECPPWSLKEIEVGA